MNNITADDFFEACPCGDWCQQQVQLLQDFLHHNHAQKPDVKQAATGQLRRPLAIVTSGGTTVPLERRCVRFIDNFSAGTRGALSVEQFLQAGYAVVFLRRKGSIEPWTQKLPSSSVLTLITHCLELTAQQHNTGHCTGAVQIAPQHATALAQSLSAATSAQQQHQLLQIEFENIFEYLQLLRAVALTVSPYKHQVLFYLAAAVSDFYVPWDLLAEHKIQSKAGDLSLELKQVPKVLGRLVHDWAPGCCVVSFKLETDTHLLLEKACTALNTYGVHAVVANLLHNRKDRVLLVMSHDTYQATQQLHCSSQEQLGTTPNSDMDIAADMPVTFHTTRGDAVAVADAGSVEWPCAADKAAVAVTTIVRMPHDDVIERKLVRQVVRVHAALSQQQQQQQQQQQCKHMWQ